MFPFFAEVSVVWLNYVNNSSITTDTGCRWGVGDTCLLPPPIQSTSFGSSFYITNVSNPFFHPYPYAPFGASVTQNTLSATPSATLRYTPFRSSPIKGRQCFLICSVPCQGKNKGNNIDVYPLQKYRDLVILSIAKNLTKCPGEVPVRDPSLRSGWQNPLGKLLYHC